MKKHILFILLITLFLSGCISRKSTIDSGGGPLFKIKIENLFIVIDMPDDISYATKLAVNLKEQFNNQNIKCDYLIKGKLDLNPGEVVAKSGASHILTINLFSQFYDDYHHKTVTRLSLKIYDIHDNTPYSAYLVQDLRPIRNANQAKDDAKLIVEDIIKKNN
ncbi:MAG: hypothetical protein LBT29_09145 [Flavobacteriaceae bacterium]|nr:hypothetical protein [Flavobacteriaceae bacterium]